MIEIITFVKTESQLSFNKTQAISQVQVLYTDFLQHSYVLKEITLAF